MSRRSLSRRTFLRGAAYGVGVSLALPMLESMLNTSGTALADGASFPKRMVLWFWGNGGAPGYWAPTTMGEGWTPSALLSPLAPLVDDVNVITGTILPTRLWAGDAIAPNAHADGCAAIMAGGNAVIDPSYTGGFGGAQNDWDYMTAPGPSLDQVAASYIKGDTRLRSVEAAVTYVPTLNTPGTATLYISYNGPYNYNAPAADPHALFMRLFSAGVPATPADQPSEPAAPDPVLLARASVLDSVLDDAASLRRRLGQTDRLRLDAHMQGVRELEQRVRALAAPQSGNTTSNASAVCAMPSDPANPASDRARAGVTADLIAMAFACDITRVATVQFSCPASHVDYPDINVGFHAIGTSFHEYEHGAGLDDTVRRGLSYFVQVYADFVATLKATPEGTGTLLDQSCVIGTSEMANGYNHGFVDHPMLVAGRAGGALRARGAHISAQDDMVSRVIFTCLRAVGCPITSWGTGRFYVDQVMAPLLA